MKVLVRGDSGRIRKLISLSCSGYLHGSILAWVAFGPAMGPAERRRSLYEQQIKPDEHRIIWYNLKERLPEVAPAEKSADVRPPRAVRPFEQPLLAEGESTRPPQLISIPAPEMALPKLLPLPNVVSAATPRRVAKLYAPPPEKPVEMATAPLPEAPKIEPKVDAKLPFEPPRPLRKKFNTPESRLARQADVTLPEAPRVETRIEQPQSALANSAPRAQPRAFRPPKETPQPASPTLALPEAPLIAGATDPKSLPSAVPPPRPLLRAFAAPPPSAPRREGPAALPAAPELLRNPAALPTTPLPAGPKPFLIAPKNSTAAAPAPPRQWSS